jgi:hypothetical protein
MTNQNKRLRDIPDEDIVAAPLAWRRHVESQSWRIFGGPSSGERQLANHCVRYAEEVLRLRRVIRNMRDAALEADND